MDAFSRNLDKNAYNSAVDIYHKIHVHGYRFPPVKTYEVFTSSSSWPYQRVRFYDEAAHHLDTIKMYEDNLNRNIGNQSMLETFIFRALQAKQALINRYGDRKSFVDPSRKASAATPVLINDLEKF